MVIASCYIKINLEGVVADLAQSRVLYVESLDVVGAVEGVGVNFLDERTRQVQSLAVGKAPERVGSKRSRWYSLEENLVDKGRRYEGVALYMLDRGYVLA